MAENQSKSVEYQVPIDILPLNVIVYRYDGSDFIIIDFNKQAEITEGLKKEALLGKKLCDVFPNVKSFGLYDVLLRVHKNGGDETFDDAHYSDERISGWRKNRVIKLQDGDVMAIYEDLTKVKQLEVENHKYVQELQEREEKFRTIAENTSMGIFIYQDYCAYVNDALISLTEYSREELYKMKIWEIIDKEYQDKVREVAQQRLQGKHFPYTYEDIKLVTKSGQFKTIRVSTQTVTYNGNFAGMGTIIDITDLKEMKEQLKMLAQAIEHTDDLVKIVNAQGQMLFINDSMIAHTGYTREELIGSHTRIFKSGFHDSAFYSKLWKTVTSGKVYSDTFVNKKKNGSIFHEEVTITPIFDENGKIEYYVSIGKDISQRKLSEQSLHDAEELYHKLFDLSPVGIVVIEPETGKAVEFNQISHTLLGYTAQEFAEISLKDYEAIETPEETAKHIEALKNGNPEVFETKHKTKNGENRDVIVSAQLIFYKNKPYIFSVYQDVTQQKENEKALNEAKAVAEAKSILLAEQAEILEEYAFLDSLTHLPNRRKFDKVFDAEWRRALRNKEPLSLCMIDIDFFKAYNDTLGHDEGDVCLEQVASVISRSSSRGGELAARYGGEEFIVLLPNCDGDNAYQSGENIRQSVEALAIKHPNSKVASVVTISVGCATLYPFENRYTKKDLIKLADEALYEAKDNGRNRVNAIVKNKL
jgi:diguanylate cyclase (GGDEF)-like protein/PAS domain S-box-containing protein